MFVFAEIQNVNQQQQSLIQLIKNCWLLAMHKSFKFIQLKQIQIHHMEIHFLIQQIPLIKSLHHHHHLLAHRMIVFIVHVVVTQES